MSLAISSRIVCGVIVVDVAGRLCFLNVALRDRVNEWLQEGRRAFVFNLANVLYADSFGLGQLITVSNSIRSKGGQLILLMAYAGRSNSPVLTLVKSTYN